MFRALITKGQYYFLPRITGLSSQTKRSQTSKLLPSFDCKQQLLRVDSPCSFRYPLPISLRFLMVQHCMHCKCNNWIVIPPNNFYFSITSVVIWPSFFPLHLLHGNQWTFYQAIFSYGSSSLETLPIQAWEQMVAWEKTVKVYTVITSAFTNFQFILYHTSSKWLTSIICWLSCMYFYIVG